MCTILSFPPPRPDEYYTPDFHTNKSYEENISPVESVGTVVWIELRVLIFLICTDDVVKRNNHKIERDIKQKEI